MAIGDFDTTNDNQVRNVVNENTTVNNEKIEYVTVYEGRPPLALVLLALLNTVLLVAVLVVCGKIYHKPQLPFAPCPIEMNQNTTRIDRIDACVNNLNDRLCQCEKDCTCCKEGQCTRQPKIESIPPPPQEPKPEPKPVQPPAQKTPIKTTVPTSPCK